MKRTVLYILGCILLMAPWALTARDNNDFVYVPSASGASVTSYTGTNADVVVPDTLGSLPVTAIAALAFVGNTNLATLVVPDTVTTIGDRVFLGCANLGSVTLGQGVVAIGAYAFDNCVSLTNINIPNSMTNIGDGIFLGCGSLSLITIPDSVISMGNNTFGSCTNLTSINLGNGITRIGDYAFDNCTGLTNVSVPANVINIGAFAFEGCVSLAAISIPDSLMSISINAFEGCGSLTGLTFPSSINSIADHAFDQCSNLTSIVFLGNTPSLGGQFVFAGDYTATVYYLPGTIGWAETFGGLPTVSMPLPIINSQPQSVTTNIGAIVAFNVQASSNGPLIDAPLTYQWLFNGAPIDAATTDSLTVSNALPPNSGEYSVIISNAAGSVTSSQAELTVQFTPPTIQLQPQSVTTNLGAAVMFSIQASGDGLFSGAPLSYQWFFNDAPIDSATTAKYTLDHVMPTNAGGYSVVVSNVGGVVTSAVAELTVQFTHSARATEGIVDGALVITIYDAGYGYTNTPTVEILGGGGSGAQAVAVVANGVLTGISIIDPGSGYTDPPLVVIAPPFSPTLSLVVTNTPASAVAVIPTANNLILGQAYQLQASTDLSTWTNSGSSFTVPFTATNSSVVCDQCFNASDLSQLFLRLEAVSE
jgi:hypothetical protein